MIEIKDCEDLPTKVLYQELHNVVGDEIASFDIRFYTLDELAILGTKYTIKEFMNKFNDILMILVIHKDKLLTCLEVEKYSWMFPILTSNKYETDISLEFYIVNTTLGMSVIKKYRKNEAKDTNYYYIP